MTLVVGTIMLLTAMYMKVIVFFSLSIALIVMYEAKNFLKDPSPNKCIIEPSLNEIPRDYPLIKLLQTIFSQAVFALCYSRIYSGGWAKFPKPTLSLCLKLLISILLGLNRSCIECLLLLFKASQYHSLEDFLLAKAQRRTQHRKLVYYKGNWKANASWLERMGGWCGRVLGKSDKELVTGAMGGVKHVEGIILSHKAEQIPYTISIMKSEELLTRAAHRAWPDISRDSKFIAYSTDAKKAALNDNYGLEMAVRNIAWKKETTILLMPVERQVLLKKMYYIGDTNIISGGAMFGFNESAISEQYSRKMLRMQQLIMQNEFISSLSPEQRVYFMMYIRNEWAYTKTYCTIPDIIENPDDLIN